MAWINLILSLKKLKMQIKGLPIALYRAEVIIFLIIGFYNIKLHKKLFVIVKTSLYYLKIYIKITNKQTFIHL